MKLIKTNIIAALSLFAVTAFTACSKNDGAIPERIGIEDVPAVSTNTETGGTTGSISLANQGTFQGKFKVSLYFAGATPPSKVDVVVRKNGSAANVKLYNADVKSLPASFTVTTADIATLFGAPIAVKDTYDFAPDIYVNGKKYEAFPAVGLGAGQGVTGMSAVGYGAWVRYTVGN